MIENVPFHGSHLTSRSDTETLSAGTTHKDSSISEQSSDKNIIKRHVTSKPIDSTSSIPVGTTTVDELDRVFLNAVGNPFSTRNNEYLNHHSDHPHAVHRHPNLFYHQTRQDYVLVESGCKVIVSWPHVKRSARSEQLKSPSPDGAVNTSAAQLSAILTAANN